MKPGSGASAGPAGASEAGNACASRMCMRPDGRLPAFCWMSRMPLDGVRPPVTNWPAVAQTYWPIFLLINPTAASNAASIPNSVVSGKSGSLAGVGDMICPVQVAHKMSGDL